MLQGPLMIYIDEHDWLDVVGHHTPDPVAEEHVIALAKLKWLVVVGTNGFEYIPVQDDQGTWSLREFHGEEDE